MSELLRAIQTKVGVTADGAYGPNTERAIAKSLGVVVEAKPAAPEEGQLTGLTVTEDSLRAVMEFECGGKSYYEKMYSSPSWPQGASGVTVGVGYDLGYNTKAQIMKDWSPVIGQRLAEILATCAGIKGSAAQSHKNRIKASVKISFEDAWLVFVRSSVPRFAKMTVSSFPNYKKMHNVTQAMMLSVVFNRGSSLSGNRRRHMVQMRDATTDQGVINAIDAMKAIWPNSGGNHPGLRNRRNKEVTLIANRGNDTSKLIHV